MQMSHAANRRVVWPWGVAAPRCLLAALLGATSLGCEDDKSPAGPSGVSLDPTVSFEREVKPLLAARCAICHYEGSQVLPYLDDPLDPDTGLINFENTWFPGHDSDYEVVVRPGKPDESFLIYKVEANPDPAVFDPANNGSPMPLQVPVLSAAELGAVRKWITDGAQNDSFFKEEVAPIFGTQPVITGAGGKCTYCHYDGSPTGLSVIDVFDPVSGLVGVDSVLSTKLRVKPGAPDESFLVEKLEEETPSAGGRMPLHYPRLSEAEVARLRTWIAEGAQDN